MWACGCQTIVVRSRRRGDLAASCRRLLYLFIAGVIPGVIVGLVLIAVTYGPWLSLLLLGR